MIIENPNVLMNVMEKYIFKIQKYFEKMYVYL